MFGIPMVLLLPPPPTLHWSAINLPIFDQSASVKSLKARERKIESYQ